ncbi:LysR family transcriptional regulator [Saccharopolyspora karakumensis]|uniref:LysR family transcriptional regulator n=1 Tax=Saccharopolyspora karakumensis TaxID=2530386 RepID=A0A4R5BDL3_9PSEU|nr:LysR family transcriptional regulator [Saccharopolyspora karakumensis]TDD81652.1 LysR family transcriptional regulator [Saccharopolyspora karakumensis]
MLLRQLEYLTTLAREKHFARAAEACYISQPAMSAAIRKLEAELHVQIIQRGNRFIGFTPEGERILKWAYRILAERDALIEDVGAMREGLSGRLRIGCIPTALCVVPILTSLLCQDQPRVRVQVSSMTSIEIQRGLSQYGLDVGVTYIDNEPLTGVRTVPLYSERYLLLAAEDDLDDGESATWAEAAEHPLCLLSEDMQNRRILNSVFEQAQAKPQPAVETNSISALYAHVREGPWATVLPHSWLLRFGVPEGMRAVPLAEPQISKTIGLVLHDRDPEPILARAFVDTARRMDLDELLDATTPG